MVERVRLGDPKKGPGGETAEARTGDRIAQVQIMISVANISTYPPKISLRRSI